MNYLKLFVILFLTLGVCACSSSDQNNPKEIVVDTPEVVEATSIEEQNLYESSELELVAKRLEVKDTTTTLTIHALNHLNTTVQVEVYMSSVNGFAIDPSSNIINLNFLSEEDYSITFFNDDLLNHNIGQITEFEFIFNIYELDEEFEVVNSITTDSILIKTASYGSYKSFYDNSGTILYDHHDIRIISKGIEEGDLTLFIENNSDYKISLVYKVNTTDSDGISYVVNMAKDKKAIRRISVSSDDLSQLQLYIGIENIDTTSLLDSTTLSLQSE